jgi:uncharacterized protein (DUF779 family)
LTQPKSYRINKNLAAKHGDLMFYQVVVKERNRNALKREGSIKDWDICIGSIENTEFWVDKDLFEYWKHSHFTLDVIDAFGVGGFLETPKKDFQN